MNYTINMIKMAMKNDTDGIEAIVGMANSKEAHEDVILDRNKMVLDYSTKLNAYSKTFNNDIKAREYAKMYVHSQMRYGTYNLKKEADKNKKTI